MRASIRGEPIVIDDFWADEGGALRDAIIAQEKKRPSAPTLNLGGWRSAELATQSDPAIAALIAEICGRVGADVSGWAMINRGGSSHPRHWHDGSVLSGVYYVDPGEDPSPPTIFELGVRGRRGTRLPRGAKVTEREIAPVAGRLVLFPGDLWHRVPAYAGGAPRITVAFDAKR
jgi:uncharacterized protein (TIGR02466 family)